MFEYVERNLLQVLESRPGGLHPAKVRLFTWQLVKAVAACHARGVAHRDVKPENILVSRDGETLKLCDFGFARVLPSRRAPEDAERLSGADENAAPRMARARDENDRKNDEPKNAPLTEYVATRWYRAPELLLGSRAYDKNVDVFAVGCLMGEMADGQPMFPGESDADQLHVVQRALGGVPRRVLRESTFSNAARAAVDATARRQKSLNPKPGERPRDRYGARLGECAMRFMEGALRLDPAERLDWRRALAHPYFRGMDGWRAAESSREDGARSADGADAATTSAGRDVSEPKAPEKAETRKTNLESTSSRAAALHLEPPPGERRASSNQEEPRARKSLAEAREEAALARARRKREEAQAEAEAAERRREARARASAARLREAREAEAWRALEEARLPARRLERETARVASRARESRTSREQREERDRERVFAASESKLRDATFATLRVQNRVSGARDALAFGESRLFGRERDGETRDERPDERHRSRITGFGGFRGTGFDVGAARAEAETVDPSAGWDDPGSAETAAPADVSARAARSSRTNLGLFDDPANFFSTEPAREAATVARGRRAGQPRAFAASADMFGGDAVETRSKPRATRRAEEARFGVTSGLEAAAAEEEEAVRRDARETRATRTASNGGFDRHGRLGRRESGPTLARDAGSEDVSDLAALLLNGASLAPPHRRSDPPRAGRRANGHLSASRRAAPPVPHAPPEKGASFVSSRRSHRSDAHLLGGLREPLPAIPVLSGLSGWR